MGLAVCRQPAYNFHVSDERKPGPDSNYEHFENDVTATPDSNDVWALCGIDDAISAKMNTIL